MKLEQNDQRQGVFHAIANYREFLPYGKTVSKSTSILLLNYNKKILVNTGVIESQSALDNLIGGAGISYNDIDMVINTSPKPEHIGLNAYIQSKNPDVRFYAHPKAAPYIENTALEVEEKQIYGFYKLVSGNTYNVKRAMNGLCMDIGGEEIVFCHIPGDKNGRMAIYLKQSRIIISGSLIAHQAANFAGISFTAEAMPVRHKELDPAILELTN